MTLVLQTLSSLAAPFFSIWFYLVANIHIILVFVKFFDDFFIGNHRVFGGSGPVPAFCGWGCQTDNRRSPETPSPASRFRYDLLCDDSRVSSDDFCVSSDDFCVSYDGFHVSSDGFYDSNDGLCDSRDGLYEFCSVTCGWAVGSCMWADCLFRACLYLVVCGGLPRPVTSCPNCSPELKKTAVFFVFSVFIPIFTRQKRRDRIIISK